jgi:hypothetical protein
LAFVVGEAVSGGRGWGDCVAGERVEQLTDLAASSFKDVEKGVEVGDR